MVTYIDIEKTSLEVADMILKNRFPYQSEWTNLFSSKMNF